VPDRAAQGGTEAVAQPFQTRQHLGIVAAKAHDFAKAFVDGAIGAVAEGFVFDHQQGLRHGGHARHRANGVEGVIGLEVKFPGGGLFVCVVQIAGPALENGDALDRAAHRATHPVPFNRGTSMEDHAGFQGRDGFMRRDDIDQHRIAGQHPVQRFGVGFFD
jgi:hypothetical protein